MVLLGSPFTWCLALNGTPDHDNNSLFVTEFSICSIFFSKEIIHGTYQEKALRQEVRHPVALHKDEAVQTVHKVSRMTAFPTNKGQNCEVKSLYELSISSGWYLVPVSEA